MNMLAVTGTFVICLSLAPASAEPPAIETVAIEPNRAFHVNGKPFFPIMAWLQNPENFDAMKSCGMNTIAGYWPKSGGTKDVNEWTEEQRTTLYPAYIESTDVVGYDIYPIYGWNKPEWIHLVYEATGRLTDSAKGRPVYAWIETSKGGQWTGALSRQKEVTPEHIRAEVWMAICSGATAIGYFTHIWKPSYSQFGVPEVNRQALAQINAQITRLTPAILGQPPKRSVSISSDGGVKLGVLAREADGALYIFAVNYDERYRETPATIQVEGLAAGAAVTVVDEDRKIEAAAGVFSDMFAPLAVHIYRLR